MKIYIGSMERLTYKLRGNCGFVWALHAPGPSVQDAIDRLAAYEDTGLAPWEITVDKPACVFYCNRKCGVNGDWCAEGPGCPWELTLEEAARMLEAVKINRPLTREELQKMDGEPVWIARLDAPEMSRWYLIDGCSRERLLFCGEYGGYVRWDELGSAWTAYRSRPKEEENEMNAVFLPGDEESEGAQP